MSGFVLDLFAGPGGWDVAAACLGLRSVGVEHDASACATRAAAGHLTIRQDVGSLDTARFRQLDGLIASPPCPTFSAAGDRAGILEMPHLLTHVRECVDGWKPYIPPKNLGFVPLKLENGLESIDPILPDPRSRLVLEPLRFILDCWPRWVALEQVPDVLPAWEAYRYVMQKRGYFVWCGILNAADYGVPQTRRRAILMAHQLRPTSPPEPTHCQGGARTMFGELLPWVSMAQALGWDGFDAEYQRGAGMLERYGPRASRPCEAPAPTLTGTALGAGAGAKLRLRMRGNHTIAGGPLAERSLDEPAMTVGTRADLWKVYTNRGQDADGNRQVVAGSAPAPALTAKAGGQWCFERPATTVQGDPRLAPPGHRDREGGEPQFGPDALRLSVPDALRLSVPDALRLQSFPPDYPVQGSKTKQFEQVGNAVPPLLGLRILHRLLAPVAVPEPSEGEKS